MTGSTVAVIGLGQMGLGMATTLAGKGFQVIGCDVSAECCAAAEAKGIRSAPLGEAAGAAPVAVLSLPLAKHVEAVVEGTDGLFARMAKGGVIVDTTTSEVAVSRRLAAAAEARGLAFLDAPVSGGVSGAATGNLTMMIGGADSPVAAARPVLDAMAARVVHIGPSGAGNVAKLVNNLLVASHLLTVSEAMRLAESAGVPMADVLKVVNTSTGRSAVSEINYPKWITSGSFDSGFTMGLMRKDVRLALALAGEMGAALPVSDHVARIWAASAETLGDGEDFNRIVTLVPGAKP